MTCAGTEVFYLFVIFFFFCCWQRFGEIKISDPTTKMKSQKNVEGHGEIKMSFHYVSTKCCQSIKNPNINFSDIAFTSPCVETYMISHKKISSYVYIAAQQNFFSFKSTRYSKKKKLLISNFLLPFKFFIFRSTLNGTQFKEGGKDACQVSKKPF